MEGAQRSSSSQPVWNLHKVGNQKTPIVAIVSRHSDKTAKDDEENSVMKMLSRLNIKDGPQSTRPQISDEELNQLMEDAMDRNIFLLANEGGFVCVTDSGIRQLNAQQADVFVNNICQMIESRSNDENTSTKMSITPTFEDRRSRRIPQAKLLLTPLEEDAQIVGSLDADVRYDIEKELNSSDEVIARSPLTRQDISELKNENARLSANLTSIVSSLEDKLKQSELKADSLSRENEVLKVQCRNYLSAIQILDQKGSVSSGSGEEVVPVLILHQKTMEYEKKLIQVAEMQGELFEFNDRLHKVILQKESLIKRLTEELIELRGPLPQGIEVGELDSISGVSESTVFSTIPSSLCRPLVNIWIPSAFLSEQGSSSHHIYQIYIRIKDEEWNVYRRYSQFYEMHRKFSKKYPLIGTFDFPPKKLSKKDSRVVQERRKRLESYLRSVVNMLHMECQISDRRSLTAALPFLGMGGENPSNTHSRSENRVTGQSITPNSSNSYLGL